MAAKFVLDMGAAHDNFFSDTAMAGIVCAMPGYRFCWLINRLLGFDFAREPESDVEYKMGKDNVHYFSLYRYEEETSGCTHLLYKMKSEKEALLPEIKQLDYLWLIRSRDAEYEIQDIADVLRNIPEIQLAQIIDPGRLKNIDHLLL